MDIKWVDCDLLCTLSPKPKYPLLNKHRTNQGSDPLNNHSQIIPGAGENPNNRIGYRIGLDADIRSPRDRCKVSEQKKTESTKLTGAD